MNAPSRDGAAAPPMAAIERLRRSSRESLTLIKQAVDEGLDEAKKKWEEVTSGRDSGRDSGASAEAEEQKHELSASGVAACSAVHPACSLPPPEAWPNRPLLLRRSAVAHGSSASDSSDASDSREVCSEQLGVPFAIETELFVGHAVLRLRSTPGCEEYFAGKARRTSFVVSGRFKRPLSFAQLYTGQEFEQELRVSRATQLILRGVLKAIRLVAPLLRGRLTERGSHLLSPLVQTAQAISISTAPLPLTPAVVVTESTALAGGALGGAAPLSAAERRRHFSVAAHLAGHTFDPALYYSFDFYDDKLCLDSFKLDTVLGRHDLVGILAGQPIRLLSRVFDAAGSSGGSSGSSSSASSSGTSSGSGSSSGAAAAFGWDIEIWHERLLAGAAAGKGTPTARATTRSTATGAARLGFFS